MTIQELIDTGIFETINTGTDSQKLITVPFCCDLLSHAVGRAPAGCAWITVVGNINTLAVAKLTDAACVIMAEGSVLDECTARKAKEQGVTVLRTEKPAFDAALLVYQCLHI